MHLFLRTILIVLLQLPIASEAIDCPGKVRFAKSAEWDLLSCLLSDPKVTIVGAGLKESLVALQHSVEGGGLSVCGPVEEPGVAAALLLAGSSRNGDKNGSCEVDRAEQKTTRITNTTTSASNHIEYQDVASLRVPALDYGDPSVRQRHPVWRAYIRRKAYIAVGAMRATLKLRRLLQCHSPSLAPSSSESLPGLHVSGPAMDTRKRQRWICFNDGPKRCSK